MADAGAFSKGQLHGFKRQGAERAEELRGRFVWMRHSLLAVVGGNFYYETPIIFEFRSEPVIWFSRDEEGYLLLNIRMLTTSHEPRMEIQDNFWLSRGNPDDLESPPSGKLVSVKYSNGDALKIEFFELQSAAAARMRYAEAQLEQCSIPFPMTAVEVYNRVGGTDIEFGPRETRLPGGSVMRNCLSIRCRVGIALG